MVRVWKENAAADRKAAELAAGQDGVLARTQAFDCGLTPGPDHQPCAGRAMAGDPSWRVCHLQRSGPSPESAVGRGVVRRPGAILSHETAAELWGLSDHPARQIHVTVPDGRWQPRREGLTVHRSRYATVAHHPGPTPPRTRIEDTIVDLTQAAGRLEDAISWVAQAIGGRFTTAPVCSPVSNDGPKLTWRRPLYDALRDVGEGSHLLLELRYLRDVERAHGLPRSERQARRRSGHHDDVRYRRYRLRVELDGQAAHPQHQRWRDMRRDNAATAEGDYVLRYGSADVTTYPCDVADRWRQSSAPTAGPAPPRRCGRGDCSVSP